jgi:hypothetical protein
LGGRGFQISDLSFRARVKGRALFWSLVLQILVADYFLIFGSDGSGAVGIYSFFSLLSAISFYQFRPSHVQVLIDRWVERGQFPLKSNLFSTFRISLTIGFALAVFRMISRPESLHVQTVVMALLMIPALVFVYDGEILDFIRSRDESAAKPQGVSLFKIFLLGLVSVFLLLIAYKSYQKKVAVAETAQINACLHSGHCMDLTTHTCVPYELGPTKMCASPPTHR